MFVTFEGGEGSGKSTLSSGVAAELRERGFEVLLTAEPGGTLLGSGIRELLLSVGEKDAPCPEAELLLFAADRAEHVRSVIYPALSSGTVILCDRFSDSTFAYQAENFSLDLLRMLDSFATGGMRPDMTVLLGVPVHVAIERVKRRGGQDRFDARSEDFHERVVGRYMAAASREPGRFFVVDEGVSAGAVADEVVRRLPPPGFEA